MRRSFFRRYIPVLILFYILFQMSIPAYALPNGTETLLTTDTTEALDSNPAIYGDFMVCLENQNVLVLYNLASGETIPLRVTGPLASYPAQPSLGEDTVIWQEYNGSGMVNIIRYDITRGIIAASYGGTDDFSGMDEEFTYPKIEGNTIVWQNYNVTNSDWDIAVVRDVSLNPELILYSSNNEKHPAVSRNFVVYENWTDSDHANIWRFNLSDNTSVPISALSDQETFPQISAGRIVWQARDATDITSHIETWDDGVTTRLSPPYVDQKKPFLQGDRIVVEDYRRDGSTPDIYLYEYSTTWTETWVAPNTFAAAQKDPAIWNNRIVWEDSRSGDTCGGCDSDIYLFTLGSADACPVADFSPSANAGPDPLAVVFTDHSSGSPVLYRIWNYTDGTTRFSLDPASQAFSGKGIYHTRLTVGNTKCRNITPVIAKYDIYVDTHPDADFTATPLAGFAPLTVQFTDTSGGEPASWTWDFGDGPVSHERNPRHTYTSTGQSHTVSVAVNNTFDAMAPDTETKSDYIRTFLGATGTATLPLQGITVISRYGGQFLLYNATILPDMVIPDPAILTAFHPDSAGWQNITFVSDDAVGFSDTFGNNTYQGNLSRIVFQTDDVTASGVSPVIGTGWGVNYRLETSGYPSSASISTEIWENTTPADHEMFRLVITGSNYIEGSNGIAYTARVVKTGISGNNNATINMSVDHTWLGGQELNSYIIGYGINSDGNTVGSVIPARYRFNDGALDYFEADVPEYFTTFGIAPLTGSGNPFQLITLSVTSHVSPPAQNVNPAPESDSDTPGQEAAAPAKITGATTAPTSTPAKALPDTGRSAKVYTNPQGVVTQATRLQSSDGRAAIVLPLGVVAMEAGGNPLEEISISVLPSESLPVVPPGAVFTFAGMAYDIGPDDATFSLPVTLTFTLPQAPAEQDYTVKSFDRKSGTWVDLPTTLDPATGIVTVEVSHLCCFALFTQPRAAPVAPAPASIPIPAASQVKAQPPSSAVSIFMNMIGWAAGLVLNNLVLLVAVIVITTAVALILEDKFPGSGR